MRSEALTTAIAAGLTGLPAPAVDAPSPGLTGPPGDRGFARALDRATAPPSEAPSTQESPPPERAVAEPAGDASHEVGTAASDPPEEPRMDVAAPADDVTLDRSQESPSMPDRPAGAAEGVREPVALESSALEAMMAAVLFRPAPQQSDVMSVTAAASASDQAGGASVLPAASMSQQAGAMPSRAAQAPRASQQEDVVPTASGVSALEMGIASGVPDVSAGSLSGMKPTVIVSNTKIPGDGSALAEAMATGLQPDTADAVDPAVAGSGAMSEAMRVALQGAQRSIPTRGRGTDVSRDTSGMSDSGAEALPVTLDLPDGIVSASTSSAVTAETAAVPMGWPAGMADVESVEVFIPTAKAGTNSAASADDAEIGVGDNAARTGFTSNALPMTDAANTAPVSATKAGGVQSLPVAAQVAETVRSAVLRGDHEIRLLLNPGDLGRIDIRITEQNGVLQLRLDASHGSTRDLLAREMPMLQQALEARDLRVERIQVSHSGSTSADGSGGAWQQGSNRQGQQQGERDGSPAWSPIASLTQSGRDEQGAHRAPRVIRHHGVLDRVA